MCARCEVETSATPGDWLLIAVQRMMQESGKPVVMATCGPPCNCRHGRRESEASGARPRDPPKWGGSAGG
jgi:hypothetical protein